MSIQQTLLRFLARSGMLANKIVFHQCVMCTLVSLIIVGVEKIIGHSGNAIIHTSYDKIPYIIFILIVLGSLSFFAQKTVTKAFQYMSAAKLAPYLFVSVPISSLIGWVIWGQRFTLMMVIGAILVITGVVIIAFDRQRSAELAYVEV
jgi:drug/metabolite transporter (DMT)-like permease